MLALAYLSTFENAKSGDFYLQIQSPGSLAHQI